MLTYKENKLNGWIQLTIEPAELDNTTPLPFDHYLIIWSVEGGIKIRVDQIDVELKEQRVMCIAPHQFLEFPDKHNINEVRFFRFNQPFYCIHTNDEEVSCEGILFYGTTSLGIIELPPDEQESFETLYKVFSEEMQNHDSIQGEMLRMLLKRLIIKCTRLAKDQNLPKRAENVHVELIRKFNVLVEKHFKEKKQVKDYASLMHKSPKTLSNVFLSSYSQTPLQVIHNRIILEAKRLMIYTDKSIKEIAWELGYQDLPTFSRLFKNITNKSASQFREEALLET